MTRALMPCSWSDHSLVIVLFLMGWARIAPRKPAGVIAEREHQASTSPDRGTIGRNWVSSSAGLLMRKFISLVVANSKSTHEHIFETHPLI
jgi:hypothetical protein